MSDRFDEILQSVENLAAMTARAFENVATKDDISELKTKISDVRGDIGKLSSKVENLQNRLDAHAGLDREVERLSKDVTAIKRHVGMLP